MKRFKTHNSRKMNLFLISLLSLMFIMASGQASNLTQLSSFQVPFIGGLQKRFSHLSSETKTVMKFAIYFPPAVTSRNEIKKAFVVYLLPGALCDEKVFFWWSHFWTYAAKYNFIVVSPDTSPRGLKLPREDVKEGLGWYLDATTDFWKDHYRMHSYVSKELPQLIESEFKDMVKPEKKSIMGHSMGGAGVFHLSLRNPGLYVSASAFAPPVNEADFNMTTYDACLGPDKRNWEEWDSTYLIGRYKGADLHLLVDQGTADNIVRPENAKNFIAAAKSAGVPLNFRFQKGYNHMTIVPRFMGDHFKHHAQFLQ